MWRVLQPTWEQVLFRLQIGLGNPCGDRISSILRQLKLHWPLRLSLNNYCPRHHLVAVSNIPDPQIDQVTASQFAVDGQVKHCQVTDTFAELQITTNGPDVLQLQG